MKTFMVSPGRTIGFRELASSLMFSTATPCSCATLFRLKSLVMILPSYSLASSISFRSTSRTGKVIFDDLNLERCHFLQALQDVETAAATIPFQRVGGVGDQLQFAEHELRSDDDAVEKSGLGNVRDPAVYDHAGIEDLVAFLALLLSAKDAAQCRKIQQVALVRPNHQSDVCHQQHY